MHPAQKILPHPIYGDHDCNKLEIRLNDNASTKVSYFLPKKFLRRTLKKKICLYSDVKKKKNHPPSRCGFTLQSGFMKKLELTPLSMLPSKYQLFA